MDNNVKTMTKYYTHCIGKTIVGVIHKVEGDQCFFGLVAVGGSVLWIHSDEEGKSPGFIQISSVDQL